MPFRDHKAKKLPLPGLSSLGRGHPSFGASSPQLLACVDATEAVRYITLQL